MIKKLLLTLLLSIAIVRGDDTNPDLISQLWNYKTGAEAFAVGISLCSLGHVLKPVDNDNKIKNHNIEPSVTENIRSTLSRSCYVFGETSAALALCIVFYHGVFDLAKKGITKIWLSGSNK